MDIMKELKKQANDIMKDEKKKEKAGDAVESVLKSIKKNVKDEGKKKMIDKVINLWNKIKEAKSFFFCYNNNVELWLYEERTYLCKI